MTGNTKKQTGDQELEATTETLKQTSGPTPAQTYEEQLQQSLDNFPESGRRVTPSTVGVFRFSPPFSPLPSSRDR